MAKLKTPDPKWFDYVKKGDVLEMPSGTYRVVRQVYRRPKGTTRGGDRIGIVLTIMRCSWTNRAYTTYLGNDLKKWKHTGKSVRLNTELDEQIAHDLEYKNRMPQDQLLTCCDVRYAL